VFVWLELMGQFLKMAFLSSQKIEQSSLMARLVEFGLTVQERSEELDWLSWDFKGREIHISSSTSPSIWDMHFVEVGFDSNVLRNLETLDDRKGLVDGFLELGQQLWAALPFFEGTVAPEQTGPLLYALRQASAEEMRKDLPVHKYARFFSPDAARLAQIQQWVLKAYPLATIQPLPRNGSLVIWNPTREGVARFLSEGLDIE